MAKSGTLLPVKKSQKPAAKNAGAKPRRSRRPASSDFELHPDHRSLVRFVKTRRRKGANGDAHFAVANRIRNNRVTPHPKDVDKSNVRCAPLVQARLLDLAEAEKAVRAYFKQHMAIYTLTQDGPVSTLRMFGGLLTMKVNSETRKVSLLSPKSVEFDGESGRVKGSVDHSLKMPTLDGLEQHPVREGIFLMGTFKSHVHRPLLAFVRSLFEIHLAASRDATVAKTLAADGTPFSEDDRARAEKFIVQFSHQNIRRLVNTCWGKGVSLPKAYRIAGKKAWTLLDITSAKLALSVWGQHAPWDCYEQIWANVDDFAKIHKVTPGVLPLWLRTRADRVPDGQAIPWDNADIDAAGIRERFHQMNAVMLRKAVITKWSERTSWHDPNPVQTVQQALGDDIAPKAWRKIISLSPGYLRFLLTERNVASLTLNVLAKLIGATEALPSVTVWRHLLRGHRNMYLWQAREGGPREDWLMRETAALLTAMGREGKKHPSKKFYHSHVQLLLDWHADHVNRVRGGQERSFDANQLKAGWAFFWRKQEEWHQQAEARHQEELRAAREREARLEAERQQLRADYIARGLEPALVDEAFETRSLPEAKSGATYRWESLVETFTMGDFEAVPLLTTEELVAEGDAMHHCVGRMGYNRHCADNFTRIFSVRRDGKRASTVEISTTSLSGRREYRVRAEIDPLAVVPLEEVTWTMQQNRGVCNQDTPESAGTEVIAAEIAKRYSKAFAAMTPEERYERLCPLKRVERTDTPPQAGAASSAPAANQAVAAVNDDLRWAD